MDDKSKVLALIPARSGSKGVPNKNIRNLAGKPLLAYACACGLGCPQVDRTVVSTDCPNIASVARSWGAEAPFLRPYGLASDVSPTIGTVFHALRWLAKNDRWNPDVVVLLQPTAPLRDSDDVAQALDLLRSSGADSVVSVCPIPSHFHPAWQFQIINDELQTYIGRPLADVPTRRQALAPTFVRNGAVYAFRRRALEATRSIYGRRCRPLVMPTARSVNIDTMADWHAAESYIQRLGAAA